LSEPRKLTAPRLGQLDDASFSRLRRVLEGQFGLEFTDRRRGILRMHLRDFALESGCTSWNDYISLLEGSSGARELARIIYSVTVHQTEFFRNQRLFDALRAEVFPGLALDAEREKRPLRVWSAGCSTGEEAYSLAMVAL
jgi:chemotaxis methyl-accepting protein methylase